MFDQFVELAVLGHLINFLLQVFVEEVAGFEHLAQGFAQIVQGMVHRVRQIGEGIAEAGVEQEVGERLQQVFHAHLGGQVAVVFGVANALHAKISDASC